ncbi:hypothetical protein OH76DRAFT_1228940 [Lentinus brumalis]|uniref:Uncharacterized protein n=1 Tax=Lentinus brumalis TaxID=2498619 RepID=A0A371DLZ3_9APHY|nr:hypothetical protein OH76DRAFT_1228940 [Polyporus brumalis]
MDFLHGAPRPLLLSSSRHFVDSPLHTSPCVRDFDAEITPKTGIPATERIPELACVPGDPDGALVHEILWNHFGFIPHESDSGLDLEAHKLSLRCPSPSSRSRSLSLAHHQHRRSRTSPSPPFSLPSMARKRRSLSSILVPPFIPQASSSASSPTGRARSHTVSSTSSAGDDSADWLSFYSGAASPLPSEFSSLGPVTPARNSPPADLLDEDPFANLSPAPSHLSPAPLSPLAQSALDQDTSAGSRRARSLHASRSLKSLRDLPNTPPPSPIESTRPLLARRPKSTGPPQVRPASTRPAFTPRPSLPSLNVLARTSIHVPKVRRGRPGAHLPLEPWEDQAPAHSGLSAPPSPTRAMQFSTSPVPRRRHLRRPTLSMIRDSRMIQDGDGENAEDGAMPPLQAPDTSASDSLHSTESEAQAIEGASAAASSALSSQLDVASRNLASDDQEYPPTPPPKSPSGTLHARSMSGTSTTSTVPSLCPSSPTSWSSGSTDPYRHSHSPPRAQSPLPPLPSSHIRVHLDADPSGRPGISDVYAHHRHTQLLTSDLLASLDYNYSDALSQLGPTSRLSPSTLYPAGDFEPGSSAGTIKNTFLARVQSQVGDESTSVAPVQRVASDSSGESQWSTEANDLHGQPSSLSVPLSPLSPPELPTSSSEDVSTESSLCSTPALHSSRSSSTMSSEYDYSEEQYAYYSYDLGAFRDPLGTPSSPQQRPVFGYGIPWPSTHRTSGSSSSGGSGGGMADVLSDLEDLAEDLTERFSLSLRSSNESLETERPSERPISRRSLSIRCRELFKRS